MVIYCQGLIEMAGFQLNDRISKQDLFACLCVWMEENPFASTESPKTKRQSLQGEQNDSYRGQEGLNKVGVVVTDLNDQVIALDYTRDGLHGVINVLVERPNKVRGGVVYTSRKPCSLCMKYMIQMEISRVYFLPFEPEVPTQDDAIHCDKLSHVCTIAQSLYIPTITANYLQESSQKRSPYTPSKGSYKEYTQYLVNNYWSEQWLEKMTKVFPGFFEITETINKQIISMLEFLAKVTVSDIPHETRFMKYGSPNGIISVKSNEGMSNENCPKWQEFACYMSRLANLLAQRSDDPTRGVGAVITKNQEIVAVGWNGFPAKAMYGDFPRAKDTDTHIKAKKYPYSIHAEQSTILTRFFDDIKDKTTTLFVTKMPCDECVPVISKVGIKTVVFPPNRPKSHSTFLQYGYLERLIAEGQIQCYTSTTAQCNTAIRNLVSNGTL